MRRTEVEISLDDARQMCGNVCCGQVACKECVMDMPEEGDEIVLHVKGRRE